MEEIVQHPPLELGQLLIFLLRKIGQHSDSHPLECLPAAGYRLSSLFGEADPVAAGIPLARFPADVAAFLQ